MATFYSYKGGVGRSMALANVAWLLAETYHKQVLVVDWDLEAPGLHRFFGLAERRLKPGIIDLVIDYKALARQRHESLPEQLLPIKEYIMNVEGFEGGGSLELLSAGKPGRDYSTRVTSFDWHDFYQKWKGFGFIEYLKRELARDRDFVLVDSRTGVTDISGICTVQIPDLLVVFFSLNDQNLMGTRATLDRIARDSKEIRSGNQSPKSRAGNPAPDDGRSGNGEPPEMLLIPSRVETTLEQKRRKKWEEKAVEILGSRFPGEKEKDKTLYVTQTGIPYIGYYGFGEELAVKTDPFGELAVRLRRLTDSILAATGWEQDATTPTRIERHQLRDVVAEHGEWLRSEGKAGKRAAVVASDLKEVKLLKERLERSTFIESDLSYAVLKGSSLREARLVGSDFRHADLEEADCSAADLSNADLRWTNLRGAVLDGAIVSDADFRHADLTDSKLGRTTGLQAWQLGGACLADAKLESEFLDEPLNTANGLSSDSLLWLASVAGLFVAALLIVALPVDPMIIGSGWLRFSYWFLPLVLFTCFFAWQLTSRRLWEALALLPAIWMDGKKLSEKIKPRLLNSWIEVRLPQLRRQAGPLTFLAASYLSLIFLLPPLGLLMIWVRYLPRHEALASVLQAILATSAVAIALESWANLRSTLGGREDPRTRFGVWLDRLRQPLRRAMSVALGIFLIVVTLGAGSASRGRTMTWLIDALETVGVRADADLAGDWISEKPAEVNPLPAAFRGADLEGLNLRWLYGRGVNLPRANLAEARLERADFSSADLRQAVLRSASLRWTNLELAQLQCADLSAADLEGASLKGARLNLANLDAANLFEVADVTEEQLQEACMTSATRLPEGIEALRRSPDECRAMAIRCESGLPKS